MLMASLQDRNLLAKGACSPNYMHELCPSCATSTVTVTAIDSISQDYMHLLNNSGYS